eukprot:7233750-Prymnesium_polylepis.2
MDAGDREPRRAGSRLLEAGAAAAAARTRAASSHERSSSLRPVARAGTGLRGTVCAGGTRCTLAVAFWRFGAKPNATDTVERKARPGGGGQGTAGLVVQGSTHLTVTRLYGNAARYGFTAVRRVSRVPGDTRSGVHMHHGHG